MLCNVDSMDEVVTLRDVSWLPFELYCCFWDIKYSMIPICILRNSITKRYQVLHICYNTSSIAVLGEFTFVGSVQGIVHVFL